MTLSTAQTTTGARVLVQDTHNLVFMKTFGLTVNITCVNTTVSSIRCSLKISSQ